MPRNASSVYSLPAGNPVIPGTTITTTWANTTLDDISLALTNSLSTDGSTASVSLANKTLNNVTIATMATPLSVANGGTGSTTASGARTNLGLAIGTNVQAFDADLQAIAALVDTDGILCKQSAGGWVLRDLTSGTADITITNPAGVLGNPTLNLAGDLAALTGLASTGFAVRSAADTWVQRTIVGTTGQIDVANGNGVGANPTLSIPTSLNIPGTSTGNANISQLQFTDSLGANVGTIGDVSPGNQDIHIIANSADIRLRPMNTAADDIIITSSGVNPSTSSAKDLGGSSNTWQHVYAEGIQFPSTQVPSGNANNLDDYEEGTWTPVLTFATPGNLVVAYSLQSGSYTKIGRMVNLQFTIRTSTFTHTTASGSLQITGLPFTSGTLSIGSTNWRGITKANFTDVSPRSDSASALLTMMISGSGQATTTVATGDMPTGGTVEFFGQVTFYV